MLLDAIIAKGLSKFQRNPFLNTGAPQDNQALRRVPLPIHSILWARFKKAVMATAFVRLLINPPIRGTTKKASLE